MTKAVSGTTYLEAEQGRGGTVTALLRAMQGVFTLLHNERQSFRLLALKKSATTTSKIPILSEGLNKLSAIQNSVTQINILKNCATENKVFSLDTDRRVMHLS